MGKALVVNGLVVSNPLTVVTLKSVSSILSEYYEVNTSINQNEKTALETFVRGLVDANLWLKMKYFYPLLGDNVADITKEVISNSTEDLFVNAGFSGLSVDQRILVANNRQLAESNIGVRANTIDKTKLGFICSGKSDSWYGGGQTIAFNTGTDRYGIDMAFTGSGFGYPMLRVDDTNVFSETIYSSKLERVIFGNIENNVGILYDDSTLLASNAVNPSVLITKTYGVLANSRPNNYKYNFFAITEGMSSEDWTIYYPLLLSYLKAVGKHS